MKTLQTVIFLAFLCLELSAQPAKKVLQFNQLGFLNSDSTIGNFDGGMGEFRVDLTDCSIDPKAQKIRLSGKISDKATGQSFCDIYAFIGKTDSKTKELRTTNKYNIDCSGKFELYLNLATIDNLYFWTIGYSVLECIVDKTEIKESTGYN